MMTPEIDLYFKSLCKRIGDGGTETLYFCPATDCKSVPKRCHENIDERFKLRSGRKAVRGWPIVDFGDGGHRAAAKWREMHGADIHTVAQILEHEDLRTTRGGGCSAYRFSIAAA